MEFNFTKRLEGRELKANEFSFVLKDSEGKTLETVSNDAAGDQGRSRQQTQMDGVVHLVFALLKFLRDQVQTV